METKVSKTHRNVTLRDDLWKEAGTALEEKRFPGIRSRSSLIDKALEELLNKKEVS